MLMIFKVRFLLFQTVKHSPSAARQRSIPHVQHSACIRRLTQSAKHHLDISSISSKYSPVIYQSLLSVELFLHLLQLNSSINSFEDWGKLLPENLYWLPELSGCVYIFLKYIHYRFEHCYCKKAPTFSYSFSFR